jgi:hypothetical protein
MLKNEPTLDDIRPPEFPNVGDFLVVQGDAMLGLSPGLHSLVITNIRDGYSLFDCATPDGEKDNIQIFPSEIIDWSRNP